MPGLNGAVEVAVAQLAAWGFAVRVDDAELMDAFERTYDELADRPGFDAASGEQLARALLGDPDDAVIDCRCSRRGGCRRPVEEAIACRVCPYKFPCPACLARVGQRCRRPSGHSGPLIAPHGERLDLADREALERFPYLRERGRDGEQRSGGEQLALSV